MAFPQVLGLFRPVRSGADSAEERTFKERFAGALKTVHHVLLQQPVIPPAQGSEKHPNPDGAARKVNRGVLPPQEISAAQVQRSLASDLFDPSPHFQTAWQKYSAVQPLNAALLNPQLHPGLEQAQAAANQTVRLSAAGIGLVQQPPVTPQILQAEVLRKEMPVQAVARLYNPFDGSAQDEQQGSDRGAKASGRRARGLGRLGPVRVTRFGQGTRLA